MESLEEKLKNFNPSAKNEAELSARFLNLAEAFLYGGYVSVKDCKDIERYRIYLRTVEFYCHCEGDDPKMPKDPIVYHRNDRNDKNGKYIDGDVPYFPLMAFHAHVSGIDITFENEELKLRSSALIRAYEVYDVQRKIFLTYDRETKRFVECEDEKKRVNSQSTYLYYFLNGFIGDYVKWEDRKREWKRTKDFKVAPRRNVFKYEGEEKTPKKDDKPWSYTRLEDLKKDQL